MNLKAMNMFLSEDNIKRHLEHLRTLRLKYSIIEKSFPEFKGKGIKEILRMNINKDLKDEALSLLRSIRAHEIFFVSFTELPKRPDGVMRHYLSRERLLYELFNAGKERVCGFLFLYLDKYGIPRYSFSAWDDGAFLRYEPILAVDMYEHAYFSDYGFAKEKYLHSALEYLDLERLSVTLDNRKEKGYN